MADPRTPGDVERVARAIARGWYKSFGYPADVICDGVDRKWRTFEAQAAEVVAEFSQPEGTVTVPRERLREWYTGAWRTWLATLGEDGEEADLGPTPAHLREMEALLTAAPTQAGEEG